MIVDVAFGCLAVTLAVGLYMTRNTHGSGVNDKCRPPTNEVRAHRYDRAVDAEIGKDSEEHIARVAKGIEFKREMLLDIANREVRKREDAARAKKEKAQAFLGVMHGATLVIKKRPRVTRQN